MSILRDLGLWFWRLLPANPIVVRVVSMGSKRTPHLAARCAYLTVMIVVTVIFGAGFLKEASLAELAKGSTNTFMWVSLVQLGLMSFIAPVFTAAAITQEKDANTFHILLTTPLSNAQIVLGSLLSRLFFVWVLLLSGLPIFGITMIYGGVTRNEIFESFGLAACTGLVTGSLAIAISFLKFGTRRTIFSFFAGVAIYLLLIFFLGTSGWGQLAEAEERFRLFGVDLDPNNGVRMSWLAAIHPFLALAVVTGQTPAPDPAKLHGYGWPWGWLLANPQYGYMLLTTLVSFVLILLSLIFVRRGAKEGENTIGNRIKAFIVRRDDTERFRKPRRVWKNPIAWREAATRASAGGRSALRWMFIVGGLAFGIALLIAYESGAWGMTPGKPADVRWWLTALIWMELAVILLVVTNTAAATLTREKESMTIELLLCTPLTSKYIIAGMMRGLVSFAVPLISVPAGTLLVFVGVDLFRAGPAVTTPEAAVCVPLLMIAFCAMAAMIGLQFSLTSKKTMQAVMISTVIVMGAAGLMWGCGLAMKQGTPMLTAMSWPFFPFPAIQGLIDPEALYETGNQNRSDLVTVRVTRVFASVLSAAVYLAITYSLYRNMIRSFDMTVRRQTA